MRCIVLRLALHRVASRRVASRRIASHGHEGRICQQAGGGRGERMNYEECEWLDQARLKRSAPLVASQRCWPASRDSLYCTSRSEYTRSSVERQRARVRSVPFLNRLLLERDRERELDWEGGGEGGGNRDGIKVYFRMMNRVAILVHWAIKGYDKLQLLFTFNSS